MHVRHDKKSTDERAEDQGAGAPMTQYASVAQTPMIAQMMIRPRTNPAITWSIW